MKKIIVLICLMIFWSSFGLEAKELVEEEPFVYNDSGRRDPFWPLLNEAGSIITYDEADLSASDMVLTGVLTGSDGRSLAIINGKVVKEGDMIGAFKVEQVTSIFVVLDNGQEKTQLYLRKEE